MILYTFTLENGKMIYSQKIVKCRKKLLIFWLIFNSSAASSRTMFGKLVNWIPYSWCSADVEVRVEQANIRFIVMLKYSIMLMFLLCFFSRASGMAQGMAVSVCVSTTFVQSEITHQLFDELWHFDILCRNSRSQEDESYWLWWSPAFPLVPRAG